MTGDDRSRFCTQCEKNVYQLSGMTAEDIATLVLEKEGALCARFYQRPDGTMLTADCPVGVARIPAASSGSCLRRFRCSSRSRW